MENGEPNRSEILKAEAAVDHMTIAPIANNLTFNRFFKPPTLPLEHNAIPESGVLYP